MASTTTVVDGSNRTSPRPCDGSHWCCPRRLYNKTSPPAHLTACWLRRSRDRYSTIASTTHLRLCCGARHSQVCACPVSYCIPSLIIDVGRMSAFRPRRVLYYRCVGGTAIMSMPRASTAWRGPSSRVSSPCLPFRGPHLLLICLPTAQR